MSDSVRGLTSDGRREIASRKESHASSERIEDRMFLLASIVESSDDAIITKTSKGVITSWNRGAERIYGFSADEVVGRPVSILIPPGHADEVPGILDRIEKERASIIMRRCGRQGWKADSRIGKHFADQG